MTFGGQVWQSDEENEDEEKQRVRTEPGQITHAGTLAILGMSQSC